MDLQHYSPLLKEACVIQVMLDKWLPLSSAELSSQAAAAPRALGPRRLETRLAQITLDYLKIALVVLLFKVPNVSYVKVTKSLI